MGKGTRHYYQEFRIRSHPLVVGTVVLVLLVLGCMGECAGSVVRAPSECLLDADKWMTPCGGASAGNKLAGHQ